MNIESKIKVLQDEVDFQSEPVRLAMTEFMRWGRFQMTEPVIARHYETCRFFYQNRDNIGSDGVMMHDLGQKGFGDYAPSNSKDIPARAFAFTAHLWLTECLAQTGLLARLGAVPVHSKSRAVNMTEATAIRHKVRDAVRQYKSDGLTAFVSPVIAHVNGHGFTLLDREQVNSLTGDTVLTGSLPISDPIWQLFGPKNMAGGIEAEAVDNMTARYYLLYQSALNANRK